VEICLQRTKTNWAEVVVVQKKEASNPNVISSMGVWEAVTDLGYAHVKEAAHASVAVAIAEEEQARWGEARASVPYPDPTTKR
jgi:hypothetical protein